MAAIEFAVKFDDGIGGGLAAADIVLVGVSRTSKTPLSMYLGYMGYKTANVPVVRGIVRGAAAQNYAMQSIVLGIVRSTPFQMRTKLGDTGVVAPTGLKAE